VQGIGGACLLANAAAIITDAFPANQRGMESSGSTTSSVVSGLFVVLVLGGLLAPIDWRLVFLISVARRAVRNGVGHTSSSRSAASRSANPNRLVGQTSTSRSGSSS